MKKILKCVKCGNYTLSERCVKCGAEAVITNPPKYSPEDKYGEYRRKAKLSLYKEKELI